MKTKNGFTLLENLSEVKSWLNNQSVSRSITRLQVHHMALPDYACWASDQKKTDPHLTRTINLDSYGKTQWGSNDGKGKYIAQHFNVFPDGKITTGRSLNSNPIGISGWNSNAICVEIYGNFDKGKDSMTTAQRNAVIGLYGELCKKFKITPSSSTIRYHAWFTSGGTYLGDYKAGQSRKTCPGTNFFGGNTMAAFNANFLPAIKNYINNGSISGGGEAAKPTETAMNKTALVNASSLNVRKEPDANATKLGSLADNTQVTITAKCSNGWYKIKYNSGYGYVNGSYLDNFKDIVSSFTVKINTDSLNIRSGAGTSYSIVGTVKKGEVYTIVQTSGDWGLLKSKVGWINLNYTIRN